LRLQGDHSVQISSLDNRIHAQSSKIAELEKANRSLQNEKAVLSAAVEARESKLIKMGELQTSFAELSQKVAQGDALRVELEESHKRYQGIQHDLQQVQELEQQWKSELEQANITVEHLSSRIQAQEEGAVSVHSQLDMLQKKNQQLKGERNNYKQKNDSLSKEISRLCRNGRAIKDIEKVMDDHQALLEEVEALRKQKRKALEDAHMYRTSYEQCKVAQQLAGVESETRNALERNAELERMVTNGIGYDGICQCQGDAIGNLQTSQ
jgi:chromosome segregation ATPase